MPENPEEDRLEVIVFNQSRAAVSAGNPRPEEIRQQNTSSSYGSVESESEKALPSNVSVTLSVIGFLGVVFLCIGIFGAIFIHDNEHRNHLEMGLVSTYLMAVCLAVILGGGLSFFELPEHLMTLMHRISERLKPTNELP